MAGYVFISYTREEADFVADLVAQLNREFIDVWHDREIHHGASWPAHLAHLLEHCAAVVLVETPEAEKSTWVTRELLLAQRHHKVILPLLVRGRPMPIVIDLQHEDVRGGGMPTAGFAEEIRKLCGRSGLRTLADVRADLDVGVVPPLPVPPPAKDRLVYRHPDGATTTVRVSEGVLESRTGSAARPLRWPAMGAGVTSVVASPEGRFLVTGSSDGVRLGRVDTWGNIENLSVQAPLGERRVVAARHEELGGGQWSVRVLVSDDVTAEILVLGQIGLIRTHRVTHPVYAGAATGHGFLAVGYDGVLTELSPNGVDGVRHGGGWIDIDVTISAGEQFGALRHLADRAVVCSGRALDRLATADAEIADLVNGVRLSRIVAGQGSDAPDSGADVWLLTPSDLTALARVHRGSAPR